MRYFYQGEVRSWVWGPADGKSGPDPRRVHQLRVQARPWFPADGPVVAEAWTEVPLVYCGRTVPVDLRVPVPGGEWWTPARPFLYRVDAVLVAADGTPLDDAGGTARLRTVDQAGGVFRLNGQPELLRGGLLFGMRPPLVEQVRLLRCAPVEHLVREVLLAKNCGSNCIRVTIHESTYRGCNDPRLAEIGDQLGICFLCREHERVGAHGQSMADRVGRPAARASNTGASHALANTVFRCAPGRDRGPVARMSRSGGPSWRRERC